MNLTEKKQVILVDHEPWTQTRKKLFFDLFESAGISLEVFDVSNYLYPGYKINGGIDHASYLTKITDEVQLVEAFRKINNGDIVILECFKLWNSRKILNLIRERGAKIVKLELFGNSSLEKNKSDIFKRISLRRLPTIAKNQFQKFLLKLYFKIHNVNDKFDYIISSSVLDNPDYYINHPDYEEYITNNETIDINYPYILFVDTYFGFHPDDIYFFKLKGNTNVEAHYSSLNSFFDYLEHTYHKPVVIAAHPKFQENNNMFGNRKVIKFKTLPLIKSADLILMQVCNTFSWITLVNKPIALISTNVYITHHNERNYLEKLSNIFNIPIYNIDHVSYDNIKFREIKKELREHYIYKYLTSTETKDKLNIEILNNIISEIWQKKVGDENLEHRSRNASR